MIKNIVFDIGNVLIGFEWEDYILSLFDKETAYKVSRAMFFNNYWSELDRAVIPVDDIVKLFHSEEPEYADQIDEAFERVGECVAKCDWVIPFVDSLRERGYRVYYLSNMSEHVINSNREAFGFTDHMDGGIYSCHVKAIKPDREIYEKLFERYDLVPEECVFIDDKEENIEAGSSFGMKGIVFRSPEQLKEDLEAMLSGAKG
ncbi:MAG: HAD family phosphatase [Mogibacterium sp.]|nr:HAD family phosphatase [Mogibacterium sp.]